MSANVAIKYKNHHYTRIINTRFKNSFTRNEYIIIIKNHESSLIDLLLLIDIMHGILTDKNYEAESRNITS